MSTVEETMWSNLLAQAIEAANACAPHERAALMRAIEADPRGAGTVEVDADDVVHLFIGGRRLCSAHRLALTRPRGAPLN
jgi:hypothetical protein